VIKLKKMLKELLENKKFLNKINKFLKKKEIIDIILFGSAVRGKESPRDIDIFIIYQDRFDKIIESNHLISEDFKKEYKNTEVTGKKYKEIFKPEFLPRESLLTEGYSFVHKKFISECFDHKNYMLFKYSLKGKSKSQRVRFYYGLNGRGKEKGILKRYKCYKFSESLLICDMENSEIIKTFFKSLDIKYDYFPILIPKRIVKYNIQK